MTKVFIVHGWTYNLDKWQKLLPELTKRGLEPVLLKVPGLTEPSDKVWDIDGYIDWLREQLKGEAEPIVIGQSNGGRIGLSLAQKYPGQLKQLILIDSAGIAHNERRSVLKLKILKIVAKVGKVLGLIPPVRKLFYRLIGAQDYLQAPPNMRLTMRNMLAADQLIQLSNIKLPVTIIWGRDDTVTPLSDGQKLHDGLAGSQLFIIDEARHAPMFTHPQQVADIIKQAIEANP